jgi:Ca-activated chloride channel family protein
MKIDCQLDYETILRNQGRPVHLSLTLEANAAGSSRPRPMAFCVVLDRSGSMRGTPLQQAKEACRTMVRHLHAEDFMSIVLFDSTAEVLLPLQKVSDRKAIYKLISSIDCLGSTNLMGGWMLGRDELKKSPADRTRRLLLLSDGHLNQGIEDPDQIRALAQNGLQTHGIRTSTLGFGDGYDETIMSLLADSTNGVFYDASSADLLPAIFKAELEGLQSLSAQNVRVRVQPKTFCEKIMSLSSYPQIGLPDGRTEFGIGDFISEESGTLVLQMEVLPLPVLSGGHPAASLEGEELLGLEMLWDDLSTEPISSRTYERLVRISGTEDPGGVRQNMEIISKVATQKVGVVMEETEKLASKGLTEKAIQLLKDTIGWIKSLGGVSAGEDCLPILNNALEELEDGGMLNPRTRKEFHYSGTSFRKMKSHSSWSSRRPAPSFTRRSVAKENQPAGPEDAAPSAATTPSSDASSSKTKKPRKSSSRGKKKGGE